MFKKYEKVVRSLAESVPEFVEHNARDLKFLLILAEIEAIKEDDHKVEKLRSRAKELLQKKS